MSICVAGPIDVVDTIHGTVVADPYRWLEERDSPETEQWLVDQSARFEEYFRRVGNLDALRSRVKEVLDVETTDQIGKVRDQYFYRKRKVGEQQASVYLMDADTRTEQKLVDPSALGPYASVGIYRISNDGNWLAYELKHGGEHSKAIHVVDVQSRKILPDHLATGLARGFAFRSSGDGYYYCHDFLANDASNPESDHLIRFHRFGTDAQDDHVILRLSRGSASKLVLGSDGAMLLAVLYQKHGEEYAADVYATNQQHHDSWDRIAHDVLGPFNPFFCRGMLLLVDHKDDANGEIVELDASNCRRRRVIVPKWERPIKRLTFVRDRIYVSYLIGTEATVRVWSLDGEFLGALPLERGNTWGILPTYSAEADELFLSCESFNKPPTLYSFRPETGKRAVWSQNYVPGLKHSIVHQKLTYSAKDGKQVSMSLVGHMSSGWKDCPVIMTAYGGFGVTLTPQFSTFVLIMLELGFLLALPEIRGGEERGTEWHAAAHRRNHQVAVDDFVAAAAWLQTEGITRPEKLAIFGGSNSGLLVGAAVTQRPDLFRAALCIAPLLDMVRYHLFDRAYVWAGEYGTADDAEDFLALHGYSPYHRVDSKRNYPAILFVSGDKDTRCNPAHARKMTALLQHRAAQRSPILLDYSAQRGHAATMPLAVRIDALTNRIAFVCHELGVFNHETPCSTALVLRASRYLVRTEWNLWRHKERPLQSSLTGLATVDGHRNQYSVRQVCHAMDIACVLYFKEVKCLQRSVALTMLLRRYGLAAELVIGGRIVPAKFHAWVELKRVVVNDKPYTPQLYRELQRC
ncbi:lasso peptide biosynthesis B2 protein [Granulicella sp. L60]|uniref:lasso peptide biosynthesis B2 protein n=1 Tax=Granulicella sp. L60 TaxID=1641866 RepID=UPI00131D04DE|nr:lasso peptide biosynthesis B2 protein [Granulicella sp. L60]